VEHSRGDSPVRPRARDGDERGEIDEHYGHLGKDSDEYVRGVLDGYDAAAATG
jgi:hypothetical protein